MLEDADDRDSRSRRPFVAAALGHLGGPEAVKALRDALADRDEDVRRAAVLALAECASPGDVETTAALLHRAREDRDRPVRHFAMAGLGRMGDAAAVPYLAREFATGDADDRAFAALALGALGRRCDDETRAAVGRLLRPEFVRREDPDLRGALAVSLGLLGDPRSVEPLRAVLAERGPEEVRGHVALALGLLRDAGSADALRSAAVDMTRPVLQREAAIALGLLGDRGAATLLADVMRRSGTEWVRAGAAVALGRLGGATAATALVDLLLDEEAGGVSRGQAAVGLGLVLDRRTPPAMSRLSAGFNFHAPSALMTEALSIP
jgi:HEAT repeat protein